MYLGATDPKVKQRQAIEVKIVKAVVTEALRLGYALRVDDGEEFHPISKKAKTLYDQLLETDMDKLYVYRNDTYVGWILFVYGNDGYDVISDHVANKQIEEILAKANKLAGRLERFGA
jgi:hypothetical protein